MVAFGSCDQVLPGAICRKPIVPTPLAVIASFVGGRLAYRTGSWIPLVAGHDAAVLMIDTSVVCVHRHGACIADNNHQHMGRLRGGPAE
jgi:hypothetical protein